MWELIQDLIKRGEGVQTRDGFINDSLGRRDGQKLIAMHTINYGVWQSINCDCKLYAIN